MTEHFPGFNSSTVPRAPESGWLQYILKKTATTPDGLLLNLLMRFDSIISEEVNKLVIEAWDRVIATGAKFPEAEANRSVTPALHLGSWCINQAKPIITAYSRAPRQSKESEIAIDAFLELINRFVAPRIETFYKEHFPQQHARLKRCV